VTAEALFEEAMASKVKTSLATVYNTLHQFTHRGLLRSIAVDGSRMYFDTNTSRHHHYFVQNTSQLVDIPEGMVGLVGVPDAPAGYEVISVDIVIRCGPAKGAGTQDVSTPIRESLFCAGKYAA
jgi:Fur family iron response transcriptional regulator